MPTPKFFLLIKSLSSSEVRYFRKRVGQRTANEQTYLTVFNEILKMGDTYDGQKLAKKIERTVPYLRVIGSQLYGRIIDKLHEFHLENSIEEQVKKEIHVVKILLEKNLQKQIPKKLQRIRDTIKKYELFEQLPDLLEVELLIWDKGWYGDSVADIDNLFNRIDKEFERQRILNQYRRYRCIVRKAHLNMNRNINTDFMSDDIFKSEAQATSLRAKIEYYSALATHSFMNGKVKDAYKCNQELLKIYEENPSLIDIFPKKYILTLYHYLVDSLKLEKYDELEIGKEKMRELSLKKIPGLRVEVFERLYKLNFNHVIDNEKFVEGLKLIEEFEPLFEKYKSDMASTPLIELCYMVAYILFANEKYKQASNWLIHITQQKPNTVEEICLSAQLLELITYYEIKHIYLDNQINNVQKRIHKKRSLYESEEKLFSLLRRLINTPLAERKNVFGQYRLYIVKLKENPAESNFYTYLDLLRWIDSKINE